MTIPTKTEQEWQEFFESDDFDASAFTGIKPRFKGGTKASKINAEKLEDKELSIDNLINKLSSN